jgi:hypothetical protein
MNNIELLKSLYWINSPSGSEHGMSGFISMTLNNMKVNFKTDQYFQIYSLRNTKYPIVCCHIDQIGQNPISKLTGKKGIITGNRNIGADDKNGIWICLELIKRNPDINFIFSTCEEIGGNIASLLAINDISEFPYCLVFDRKGSSDIIGTKNDYCSIEFESAIAGLGKGFGYKPAQGIFSDCNALSYYINCVNLSCGYYNAHTDKEYTVLSELLNALEFGNAITRDSLINNTKFIVEDENIIYDDRLIYSESNKLKYDEDEIENPIEWEGEFYCPECKSILERIEIDHFICNYCNYEINNFKGEWIW